MRAKDAYKKLCKEYLSKCENSGCDGCIAQMYCTKNGLRQSRYPQKDCVKKLQDYLRYLKR